MRWRGAVLTMLLAMVVVFRTQTKSHSSPTTDLRPSIAEHDLDLLAEAWRRRPKPEFVPDYLESLIASQPVLLGKFSGDGVVDRTGEPLDPWGFRYVVEADKDGFVRIVSWGPDGLEDTPDDLLVVVRPR